jgi:hypothetical protein
MPTSGAAQLTSDPDANDLLNRDAFAFLLGVIFDQSVPYELAWRAPLELKRRLGHLDPHRILADPEAVRRAVQRPRSSTGTSRTCRPGWFGQQGR